MARIEPTPRPVDRRLAMVFQSYALYPHMTVRKNIAFPVENGGACHGIGRGKSRQCRTDFEPNRLFGSTPRAAERAGRGKGLPLVARLCVSRRRFCLTNRYPIWMPPLRVNMRTEITDLHKKLDTTMVYVTHDQVEAMTMADKIVVLRAGIIEQVGAPLELYNHPTNRFVAGFIGSPKMNFIEGKQATKHGAFAIGIRPEHLHVVKNGAFNGTVVSAEHLGSDTFLRIVQEDGVEIIVRSAGELNLNYGDKVSLDAGDKIYKFDENGRAL